MFRFVAYDNGKRIYAIESKTFVSGMENVVKGLGYFDWRFVGTMGNELKFAHPDKDGVALYVTEVTP